MGTPAIGADSLVRVSDPEVQRFLREKWERIEEQFAPTHFILFGSRINGTPHEWSDLDAIIVSERFTDIRTIKRSFHFKTIVDPHIAMTALCYTPSEFDDLRHSPVGVVADACREGLWVK